MRRNRRVHTALIAALLLLAAAFGLWRGWPARIAASAHSVWGVDVSAYQGEIDWETLSEGMDFAFIKATEGSGYKDPQFDRNLEQALETGIRIGAYHFFSFDSGWETQAANFMEAVPADSRLLPPVVDVELYGAHRSSPPEPEEVRASLRPLLESLEACYGKRPILYATESAYWLYLKDSFPEYPLWIRDVFLPPCLPDRQSWLFWQYSDRGCLPGYTGPEPCIDLNVFRGSRQELLAL